MAVNLSALSNVPTTAMTLSNLILVRPSTNYGIRPQNGRVNVDDLNHSKAPPAILFHYEGENSVDLRSDITDHFAEDNTALQDHIALAPEIIRTTGYIGELNDVVPPLLEPLKFIADKLTTIDAYTPQLSASALRAYNAAALAYSVAVNTANSVVSSWVSLFDSENTQNVISGQDGTESSIRTSRVQTKQQEAFMKFYGYWKNRTLFTVQTPWAIFQNCAIQSLRSVQNADTNTVTDFEVEFKVMRFASTTNATALAQSRALDQFSTQVDKGAAKAQNTDKTLSDLFSTSRGVTT